MRWLLRFAVERRVPLLRRWLPSLYKRWAEIAWTGGFRISQAHGLYFLTDHRNLVDRSIAFYGDWEPKRNRRLRRFMNEQACDVFLDIGANFGFYSLLVAKTTPVARIVAFEPDIRNLHHLYGNLYLNDLSKRIEVHPLAVSDSNGSLTFREAGLDALGGSHVLEAGENAGSQETVPVESVRLDDFLQISGKTIAIKIDIEGHELAALRGMVEILAGNRCFLQVECFEQRREELTAFFGERGYRLVESVGYDHYFTNLPN